MSTASVTQTGGAATVAVTVSRGLSGAAATVDQTIIDGSANAVAGNAVFDALALKAPLASPTFTGIVTAPRITGRCDGLEVFCKAGLAINAGQVVYATGASGNNIIIGLAQANTEATSSKTIGISESTLAHNATGYAITEGLMTVSISAPSAVEGDPIWLSPSTAGGMVFGAANKPSAPNHIVYLGVVTRKTGNNVVEIYVKIQNGSELDDLADVAITTPTAGQALMRGASFWENRSLVATDISDSTTAGRSLITAADAAAQRTSLGLGTLATQSGTFSGTSSGTNTGDETGARIASLITAATSKSTPVDADEMPITDSASSFGVKKVTFTNLKAFLKTYLDTLYVALTGTQTIAGDKTFSGVSAFTSTTRPTSAGTGSIVATSLMTRDDTGLEPFYNIGRVYRPFTPSFTTSGTGSATASANAGEAMVDLRSGSANSGWARASLSRGVNSYPGITGSGIEFSKPTGIAVHSAFVIAATSNTNCARIIVGAPSGTPVAQGTNPISALGYGVEIQGNGSTYPEIRAFAFGSGGFVASAWQSFGSAQNGGGALVVSSDGAGNISVSFSSTGTRTYNTTISLAGGPTTVGTSTNCFLVMEVINHSTSVTQGRISAKDCLIIAR